MDHVPADELRKGDVVLVEAGDIIRYDGEVIEGGASVDGAMLKSAQLLSRYPAAISPP